MPSTFKLNIIFHKFLVPECYETLSGEDLSHLRFVAVNAKIPKQVPANLAPYIVQERQLPWYNPFLQYNRFCETSAFFHAWKNPHIFQEDYIGFLHYDMLVKKEAIDYIRAEILKADTTGKKVLFTQMCLYARPHLTQIISLDAWDYIVGFYNTLNGTHHSIHSILDAEIPMYHSFVLHREVFHRLMYFAEIAIPRMFELLHFETRHLPFMIERIHAVFLALHRLDGGTGDWLPLPGVIHEDRLKDSWEKTGAS